MAQPNTLVRDEAMLEKALTLCKGSYQEGLVTGRYCLSGADLKGKAKFNAGSYRQSRDHLIERLREHGIAVSEIIGDYGKRILVIG